MKLTDSDIKILVARVNDAEAGEMRMKKLFANSYLKNMAYHNFAENVERIISNNEISEIEMKNNLKICIDYLKEHLSIPDKDQ